jgi:hypothetical protein
MVYCLISTAFLGRWADHAWFTATVTTMGSPCRDHFLADRVVNYIDIPDFSADVSHTRGTTEINSLPMLDRTAELTRVI